MLISHVLIYFLHLLRNLSPIYYFAVLSSSLLLAFRLLGRPQSSELKILLPLFVVIYVSILSFTSSQPDSPLIGLSRLFFLLPFVVYLFTYNLSEKDEHSFWILVVLFSVLSASSLILQIFVGPISWFAESSFGRAGVDRFASLAGSLTSYGSLLPVALMASCLILKNQFLKFIVLTILVSGGLISLQKMAFGTSVLALLVIVFRFGNASGLAKLKPLRVFVFIALALVATSIVYAVFGESPYFIYFTSLLDPSQSVVGDVTMASSIESRLSALPQESLKFWGGLENSWLGVGVFGAAGGLGYPDYPSPHNLVYETLLVFGLPIAVPLLAFFAYCCVLSLSNIFSRSSIHIFLSSASYLLLLVPSVFTGGLYYHPVTGVIFWFCCSRIFHAKHSPRRLALH